ncbi:MAG: hypothetical protein M3Z56_11895 [Bacteroidota bacterium]|nr:hypothetical protein [Bacteroidota bacterium]
MKKYLLASILVSFSFLSFCQKESNNNLIRDSLPAIKIKTEPRFYLSIHGGYAFSLGSTFKFYPDNVSSISVKELDNTPPVKQVVYKEDSKGLGDGFRAGIGFSYIINDFINAGIDIDYFKSSISKTRDSSFYSTQAMNGNINEVNYNEQYKISYQTSLLSFAPNITFKAIARPKFFIYNKLGAIIIFRPSSIQRENVDGQYRLGWQGFYRDSSATLQRKYDWGIRNPAFGFMGGIGGQAKVTEKIRVFAELQFTHVIFKVKNRLLTDFKMDGKEMLGTLSQSEKEIIFKRSFSVATADTNPNMPSIAIYQKFPITYAGLQAGIIYRF